MFGFWTTKHVTNLHLVHPIHDMEHLLEDSLQGQVHLQSLPASLEQLQQALPQMDDIVLPGQDAPDAVVPLHFQFFGHRDHDLHAVFVRRHVRLDGLVLLDGRLHGLKVKAKVVLGTRRGPATKRQRRSASGQVLPPPTWETSLWFSLSQVSLMAALRSKRPASCSSFS